MAAQGSDVELNLSAVQVGSDDGDFLNSIYSGTVPFMRVTDAEVRLNVTTGEELEIVVQSATRGGVAHAALLVMIFRDAEGESIVPENWSPISETFGSFKYLKTRSEDTLVLDRFSISVPDGAVSLAIVGQQWKESSSTWILGEIMVVRRHLGEVLQALPDGTTLEYQSKEFRQEIPIPPRAGNVSLGINFKPLTPEGTIPLIVGFFDDLGQEMPPLGDLPLNANFGSYIALSGGEEKLTLKEVNLQVPTGAKSLVIQGVDWGKRKCILKGPIEVNSFVESFTALEDFLREIPEFDPLLIIDTTAPPLGHQTLALRPNNLSAAYERHGAWVIFIPFSSAQGQSLKQGDRLFQVERRDFDYLVQSLLNLRKSENSYYICSSFPSIQANAAATLLKAMGWDITYEVRDDMEEFNRVGYSKWYSPELERLMLNTAHRVISVSSALDEKLRVMAPGDRNHFVVPNAVNKAVIERGIELRRARKSGDLNESRTVGYVGHLTSSWFDWPLLIDGAKLLPHIQFEIVGHGMPESLYLPENVTFLGPKTHEELELIVPNWKVGLIPFADMPLTRSVDPNKIYEYFAWGLRCVTAPMGLVHEYPSTWVYRGLEEFVSALVSAVDDDHREGEFEILEQFLKTASWDDRAAEMLGLLGVRSLEESSNE